MKKGEQPNFHFRLMALMYKWRDILQPRINVLKEVGIQEGFRVLDFGCGPGSYFIPLAELVGPSGKIYALDIHPLAIKTVEKRAAENHLDNVMTIQSECSTGLPDQSLDIALLYDVFHDLDQPDRVLKELHRILRRGGILSVSDHHLKENVIISGITKSGLFIMAQRRKKTYSFQKID